MTVHLYAADLTDRSKPLINVQRFQFPGGEQHLHMPALIDGHEYEWVAVVKGADANELVTAGLLADIAYQRGEASSLLLPYLPAARADRGQPFALDTYANVIGALNFDVVATLDVHSQVGIDMEFGDSYHVHLSATPLVVAAVEHQDKFDAVIAPDSGAFDRAQSVALALRVPVYSGVKERDFATGKLSNFYYSGPTDGNFLVVDDICDGGGTFAGFAAVSGIPRENLSLWITHGIFSKGSASNLFRNYKAVYTTDSHPGSANLHATVRVPVVPHMWKHVAGGL
ncbi:phosphoribosyl pyrophosphate transferase [Gordonia phage Trax]|uniref:Phosphoribosyltransferase n=1 Tax=Gordonia phage Trax TaxID=2591121 RepID=A0A515MH26_9CAUD|nr:ribose-phosphate pyrophosphokinase [Gordonia phage Trax]QDM55971.1 phosphoribosyl pyrophosphate transferase [Gordonia phage Trax]